MGRVLIVDDEHTIRELFRFIFEDGGHETVVASNGREALASIAGARPDFIVLDVSMPEMSGSEFAAELKRLASRDPRFVKIPFVVMTGENFMDPALNALFAGTPGFVCFFPKMTPPETVLEKAEAVLAGNPERGQ